MTTPQLLPDSTCLACGCLCDDIALGVAGGRIVRAERACPNGEAWFLAERPAKRAICLIDGQPASLDAGCARAAQILSSASRPLVFGLAGATCEAQSIVVTLAELLGGVVDVGSDQATALTAAVQSVGMVTATLGEVRQRADLVIFWCVDPATTHPRHFERYSLEPRSEFLPRGRADRACIVVDTRRTPTADAADRFLEISPGAEATAIEKLRALATGDESEQNEWSELFERMKAARYTAIFFQPDADTAALLTLVREMNRHTRMVALPLGSPGNATGAEQVLTWRTGRSSTTDADGRSAESLLAAGTVDAALVVAQSPLIDPLASLPAAARDHLTRIPHIVLHTADIATPPHATVAFTVATPGIHSAGTVFRCDGVPLPLRPAVDSPYPTTEAVITEIHEQLANAPLFTSEQSSR